MNVVNITQPDVTLRLDLEGVIQEVMVSSALSEQGLEAWVGRPWTDTVGDSAGNKVRRMLEDARKRRVSAFRQVTQRFPSGLELLIEYTTVRLGGRSGLIAVGKNLQAMAGLQSRFIAAQREMERDVWKLRDIETRYRLLFEASGEAVVLIRAATLEMVEANPAALQALDLPRGTAVGGRAFLPAVASGDRDALQAMLRAVREHGKALGLLVRLGARAAPRIVRASLMQSESGLTYLLQLTTPAGAEPPRPAAPLSVHEVGGDVPGVQLPPPGLDARLGGGTLDELVREAVRAFEQAFVQRALETCGGDRPRAAHLLGISPRRLAMKLARWRRTARRTGTGS
jgi:transcriptional regulator PpsR